MKRIITICLAVMTISMGLTGAIETASVRNIENKDADKPQKIDSTIKLKFNFSNPVIKKTSGFDLISISGLKNYGKCGEPILPFKTVNILLSPNSDISRIEILPENKTILSGQYNIKPGEKPVPISFSATKPPENIHYAPTENTRIDITFNQTIYNSIEPYPGKLFSDIGVQKLRGYSVLVVNLYPVQYIPKTGEIYYYENMELIVNTKPIKLDTPSLYRGLLKDKEKVISMVANPEKSNTYDKLELARKKTSRSSLVNPAEEYDYVIITNNELNSSTEEYTLQDLVDRKNAKGINTTIVLVEDIVNETTYWDANPLFNDTQAKIRNFITDAYINWGIEYVLLCGDGDGADVGGESGDAIIPHRGFCGVLGGSTKPMIYRQTYIMRVLMATGIKMKMRTGARLESMTSMLRSMWAEPLWTLQLNYLIL